MDVMTTSAGSDDQVARFQAWMPDEFEITVAVKRERDLWYALLMEFDVTGCGQTRADAVRQAFELLTAYLHDYFVEGAAFAASIRPISQQLRLRISLEAKLGRALRRTMLQLPLTDETTYSLPPGLLPCFAT